MKTSQMYSLSYPWLRADDVRTIRCCMCDGRNPSDIVSSLNVNGHEFRIRRCRADTLMWLDPQPGPLYREDLYNHPSYFTGDDDMYGLAVDDEKSTAIAKVRIAELRRYVPAAISLLEIGCGRGHLLAEARQSGFSTVQGIEFSTDAAEYCIQAGLPVIAADLNQRFPVAEGSVFDIVAGFSVLEHLDNPFEFLQSTIGFLSPRGILVIRVPDTDPHEGPVLSLLDHFWHFTRASLARMIEMTGLEVVDIFESGVFRGIQHPGEMKNMTLIAKRSVHI